MRRGWVLLLLFGLLGACADEAGQSKMFTDVGMDEGADEGQDAGNNDNNPPDPDMSPDPDMTPDPDPDMDPDMAPDPDMNPDMAEAVCGNGIVETGEECDEETDVCGADCRFVCGNSVVDAGETCDTGIAEGETGACPVACDDGNACTTNTLQGSACTAECVFGPITACENDDGCCAPGCNATNDNDCMALCGNDVLEAGETCDGDCPIDCDDGNSCTTDTMMGDASMCDVVCMNTAITACVDNDGCCPSMCDASDDNDCSPSCGDGIVDAGETCDMNCPTTCDDGDVCTAGALTGDPGQCNVVCTQTPLTCIANAMDGCCPAGCNAATDGDCAADCGNGVVEPGEQCDLGMANGTGACSATCQSSATAFRMNDLNLMDPHIYADLPFVGCNDITNSVPFGLAPPINQLLEDSVRCDGECNVAGDDDGFLDLSFVLLFEPLVQAAGSAGVMSVVEADCTAPLATTTCSPTTGGTAQNAAYNNSGTGTCLSPIANTTRPYTPGITSSTAPCFASAAISLSVDVGGIIIPLQEVQVAATYVGNPATSLSNGLLRGFLSEADANNILLPTTIAVVGGDPLSSLLPGGAGNCAGHSDKDTGPDGTTVGWWFYFNFPAAAVPWTP